MNTVYANSAALLYTLSNPVDRDIRSMAQALFDRAYQQSCLQRLRCRLTGRPSHLLELDEVTGGRHPGRCYSAGQQTVPVDRILGSDGRGQDFIAGFYPGRPSLRARWERVAALLLSGETLPPVKLIRVGETYFVRDGHHRISAMRALGVLEIEAEIIVWEPKDYTTEDTESTEI